MSRAAKALLLTELDRCLFQTTRTTLGRHILELPSEYELKIQLIFLYIKSTSILYPDARTQVAAPVLHVEFLLIHLWRNLSNRSWVLAPKLNHIQAQRFSNYSSLRVLC